MKQGNCFADLNKMWTPQQFKGDGATGDFFANKVNLKFKKGDQNIFKQAGDQSEKYSGQSNSDNLSDNNLIGPREGYLSIKTGNFSFAD